MGIFRNTDKKNKASLSKPNKILEAKNDITSGSVHEKESLNTTFVNNQNSNLFEIDQFKALRTKLLFPKKGKLPRAVAVTGTEVGEGKSFVAANLAISIAQNVDNRQTFLIDCDMRRPSIHRLFGFSDVPGLSEYLTEDIPLASLLLKPEVKKMTLLAGGIPPHNPSELLSSKKMAELLSEVQSRYDDRYIIIDLPSPRLVPEASLIARQVDGVIIVINYGRTPKSQLIELIDILEKETILGIVFNRFDTSMHSSIYRMYLKYIKRKQI